MRQTGTIVRARHRGMALVLALGVAAVVATMASALLWTQWQQLQAEQTQRTRLQADWLLQGALEWAASVLRSDANRNSTDHLGELWAVPLPTTSVKAFVNERASTDTTSIGAGTVPDALISGRMADAQGRLNLANLGGDDIQSRGMEAALLRLFSALELPSSEAQDLLMRVRERLPPKAGDSASVAAGSGLAGAGTPSANTEGSQTAFLQPMVPPAGLVLQALGVRPERVPVLEPHIVWLPEPTPVNVNTASAEVLHAAVPGLGLSQARSVAARRAGSPWRSLTDAAADMGVAPLQPELHGLASAYFEMRGDVRLDEQTVTRMALLRRKSSSIRLVAQWVVPNT
jgi:general secretion pathway protein K